MSDFATQAASRLCRMEIVSEWHRADAAAVIRSTFAAVDDNRKAEIADLVRERDELRRLLEQALPSVRGDAQMYSDLGRFHPLPAEHDQEIADAEAAKWLLVEQIESAIGKEPSND